MMAEFNLAACAEMIFTELPITERVRHIDDLGFRWRSGTMPRSARGTWLSERFHEVFTLAR